MVVTAVARLLKIKQSDNEQQKKKLKLKLTKVKTVPWGYVTAVPPVLMPSCVFDDVREGAAQSGEVLMFQKTYDLKKIAVQKTTLLG